MPQITGFSKFSKTEKIDWLTRHWFKNAQKARELLQLYWNRDEKLQRLHDEFSENTISNYYLPFGVAPNFVIDGKPYVVPMAIEESSVVAAASKSAKFWQNKGGFKTQILGTTKSGQIHFIYAGNLEKLQRLFETCKFQLKASLTDYEENMKKRGGGLLDIQLENKSDRLPNYYQLDCRFETVDAMGANFINSCLEHIAETFEDCVNEDPDFDDTPIEIVMAILSNYTPECRIKVEVSCPVKELFPDTDQSEKFAKKFVQALAIARVEPRRAVTHNKGVMNGIDAVVLATGNDFRAVEACAHAFASKDGIYSSLTSAEIEDGVFRFWMEIPLALGTVGGLTNLHPLVKLALEMLGNPSAKELMKITAATGLAQNFGAIKSLITTGIQEGHMKMHLMNILNQHGANKEERQKIIKHFKDEVVSHASVIQQLEKLRN